MQERIRRYFDLVDGETEEQAKAFSELFTTDGSFVVDQARIMGRPGMFSSHTADREVVGFRADDRTAITENRLWYWRSFPPLTHTLKEAFATDLDGHDVMVIGLTTGHDPQGNLVELRTAAHLKYVPYEGEVLIENIEIFAVSVRCPAAYIAIVSFIDSNT